MSAAPERAGLRPLGVLLTAALSIGALALTGPAYAADGAAAAVAASATPAPPERPAAPGPPAPPEPPAAPAPPTIPQAPPVQPGQRGLDGKSSRLPQATDGSASISGTVTYPAGTDTSTGYTYVDVSAASTNAYVASGWVNPQDGTYSVSGLAAGDYKVEFDSYGLGLLDEWWDDQPTFASAATIALSSGQDALRHIR